MAYSYPRNVAPTDSAHWALFCKRRTTEAPLVLSEPRAFSLDFCPHFRDSLSHLQISSCPFCPALPARGDLASLCSFGSRQFCSYWEETKVRRESYGPSPPPKCREQTSSMIFRMEVLFCTLKGEDALNEWHWNRNPTVQNEKNCKKNKNHHHKKL